MANGDSLEKQIIAHLLIYRQQDSVQQLVTANFAAQIKNRDTIINIQENKYLDISKQLDYSLSQQQVLKTNLKSIPTKVQADAMGKQAKKNRAHFTHRGYNKYIGELIKWCRSLSFNPQMLWKKKPFLGL
ncbi:MAG: hypothetical protein IPK90_08045 [Chitinophagaceae bacterium]|nr:hypothetical protein [Chitinophagaceae bacterium]